MHVHLWPSDSTKEVHGYRESPHFLRLPCQRSEQLFWKRFVEVFLYANFTVHGSRPARGAFGPVGSLPGNQLVRLSNDDFLPARSQLDEPGKLGFCLLNIDFLHSGLSLARGVSRIVNRDGRLNRGQELVSNQARPYAPEVPIELPKGPGFTQANSLSSRP